MNKMETYTGPEILAYLVEEVVGSENVGQKLAKQLVLNTLTYTRIVAEIKKDVHRLLVEELRIPGNDSY